MVQRNVYVLPAVPVKVDTALEVVVTVPPVPLMILHAPVPTVGVLAANITDVSPQVAVPVWSVPALAVVGICDTVIVIEAHPALQFPLLFWA